MMRIWWTLRDKPTGSAHRCTRPHWGLGGVQRRKLLPSKDLNGCFGDYTWHMFRRLRKMQCNSKQNYENNSLCPILNGLRSKLIFDSEQNSLSAKGLERLALMKTIFPCIHKQWTRIFIITSTTSEVHISLCLHH